MKKISLSKLKPWTCVSIEQFKIYWRPGKLNYADYWTKNHSAAHHQNRKEFLTQSIVLEMLRTQQTKLEVLRTQHTKINQVATRAA